MKLLIFWVHMSRSSCPQRSKGNSSRKQTKIFLSQSWSSTGHQLLFTHLTLVYLHANICKLFCNRCCSKLSFHRAGRPLVINFGSCTWPPFMANLGKVEKTMRMPWIYNDTKWCWWWWSWWHWFWSRYLSNQLWIVCTTVAKWKWQQGHIYVIHKLCDE